MAKRILAVDDDEDFLDFVRRALPRHRVTAVATSEAALAEAKRSPPDLMLLDIGLPGLDGFDLCEMLEGIPILFVSGTPYRESRERAAFTGAAGYLEKPVKREALREAVRRALRRTVVRR
jgi:DNA-binding response OmpR family regulator